MDLTSVTRVSEVALAILIEGAKVKMDLTSISRVTIVVRARWTGVSLAVAVIILLVAILSQFVAVLDERTALADRW